MSVTDVFHAMHVRAINNTTELDGLDFRASVALSDVAWIARTNPRAAGHLARAVDSAARARHRELVGMRVDQRTALASLGVIV